MWVKRPNLSDLTQRELLAHVPVQDGSSAFCLVDKLLATRGLQNPEKKEDRGGIT